MEASTLEKSSTRLPLAEAFFVGAITSQCFAHAYVLKGKASNAMYNMVLDIARILNCKNRPSVDLSGEHPVGLTHLACGTCTDCRWIAKNAHPAVLTISRLTYQVSEKGEDMTQEELEKAAKKASQPTQIKAEQIERLLHQLGVSSEHTRIIIFTDVEELPASMPSDAIPPYEWQSLGTNEEKSFHIRPLERKLFNAASANRFLKTLEEPPPHTVFFFITETEEQLMDTIVSRCQVVPCPAEGIDIGNAPQFSPETAAFLERFVGRLSPERDVYTLLGEFEQFMVVENGFNHGQALETFQNFMRQRFVSRLTDERGFKAYREVQEAMNTALRMLASKTNENQALLQLFLCLSIQMPRLAMLG
jgi:hypothetical protein